MATPWDRMSRKRPRLETGTASTRRPLEHSLGGIVVPSSAQRPDVATVQPDEYDTIGKAILVTGIPISATDTEVKQYFTEKYGSIYYMHMKLPEKGAGLHWLSYLNSHYSQHPVSDQKPVLSSKTRTAHKKQQRYYWYTTEKPVIQTLVGTQPYDQSHANPSSEAGVCRVAELPSK